MVKVALASYLCTRDNVPQKCLRNNKLNVIIISEESKNARIKK